MRNESPDSPETNWNNILIYSFLFSQGDTALQGSIFSWLAAGPLYAEVTAKKDIPIYDLVKSFTVRDSLVKKAEHTSPASQGSVGGYISMKPMPLPMLLMEHTNIVNIYQRTLRKRRNLLKHYLLL